MKLIYISNQRLPTEKAYGIQISKMCESFADLGLNVELINPGRNNLIGEDLFSYYSVKRNFKFNTLPTPDFYWPGSLNKIAFGIKSLYSALMLVFYARRRKADVYYTRDELVAYFLSFFANMTVLEAHKFSNKRKLFYSRLKKGGMKIILISEGLKKDFVDFGFEEKNLLVAPDGVDPNLFNTGISKEKAREKVGLPEDKIIIMYSGHLYEWKGADILLKAVKLLPENFIFVFIGGTEPHIAELIKKSAGGKNILILGRKRYDEVPDYLRSADVLVLPNLEIEKISRSYTSPLKLFEYMAVGGCIVASDLPSIREILNNSNSILVTPGDPGQLAEGIKKALENTAISQKALSDVRQYFWSERARKIINFLNELY